MHVDALARAAHDELRDGWSPALVEALRDVGTLRPEELSASLTAAFRDHPEWAAAWQAWSGDQRWTPSAWVEDRRVGWYDGEQHDVVEHPDAASAAADCVTRIARWVARRETWRPA